MSLASNTTMLAILNETTQGELCSTCDCCKSNAEGVPKLLAYCFLLLGSLCGNISIIIIFYKHRDLHKTVNYFIVNMAVSDLVFPLALLPFRITAVVTGSKHWHVSGILGSIICKFIFFANQVSVLVSSHSFVWIAIDRFVAVVFPIRLGLISNKIRIVAIASTWILAAAFNFPSLVIRDLRVWGNNETRCEEITSTSVFTSQEAGVAYMWLYSTFYLFAPLSLLTLLYTAIAVVLKRQSKALANPDPNIQRNIFKKRKRAVQLSVVTMIMYYLCVSGPMLARLVMKNWRLPCAFQRVFSVLANFSVYASTIVNPVICLSFVQSYRRGLRNILCSCFRKRNNAIAKREQIILKEMKTHPKENDRRTSKDTANYEDTLDTAL